nr:hypothetical protein [uncultured Mediterranean phage uvMED]
MKTTAYKQIVEATPFEVQVQESHIKDQIKEIVKYYEGICDAATKSHWYEDENNPGFTVCGEVLDAGTKKDFDVYATLKQLENLLQN